MNYAACQVSLSISTKAPSATKARDQAAEVAAAVISDVDGVPQVSGDDVTTASVQLQPAYTSDREGNRIQDGYSFTQDLQVTLAALVALVPCPESMRWDTVCMDRCRRCHFRGFSGVSASIMPWMLTGGNRQGLQFDDCRSRSLILRRTA